MKATFTNEQIKAIKSELARLKPAKPVRADGKMTLKDAIMELAPMLVKMREKGFTSKELAEHLEKRGIVIKAPTLTRYLHGLQKRDPELKAETAPETGEVAQQAIVEPNQSTSSDGDSVEEHSAEDSLEDSTA